MIIYYDGIFPEVYENEKVYKYIHSLYHIKQRTKCLYIYIQHIA